MTASDLKQRLFPSGAIPLDTPDMLQRLRRRVKKLCKDASDALWPELVALLWPKTPEPEKPVPKQDVTIVRSGTARKKSSSTVGRRKHAEAPEYAVNPVGYAVWWGRALVEQDVSNWWQRALHERDVSTWWNEALDERDRNLQKTQEYQRKLEHERQLALWDDWFSGYTDWWKQALAERDAQTFFLQKTKQAKPLVGFEYAGPIAEAVVNGTAGLEEECKSGKSLKLAPSRKRNVPVSRAELFADEDWWKTALTGFAPVSDDDHMVAYLIRHFGKAEALSILRELLPEGQVSLRPPRKPRVNMSAKVMSNNLKYQENRSSDVVKVEQAQTTIKACRRYFPNLEVTPKEMRSQFPLPKKKSASSSMPEISRTANMAEKASRAAESRAAIFAD